MSASAAQTIDRDTCGVQAGLPGDEPRRWKQPFRLYVVFVVVAVVTAIGAVTAEAASLTSTSHPGGDPGGRMFAQLKAVTSAILPTHAHIAVRQSQFSDAQWLSCPSSPPGSDGWTGPISDIQFGTAITTAALVRRAESVARRQGWTDPKVSHRDGDLVIEWHRTLDGSPAGLQLSNDPFLQSPVTPWNLDATAKALGRQYDQHSGACA